MADNIVPLHPAASPQPLTSDEAGAVENLTAFCEKLHEGMQHVTAALIGLETRIRRMELDAAKAAKQKVASTAIFNPQGERVN